MKLYKRIFLFPQTQTAQDKNFFYLRFYILVTRCSIGIRRNRNSFLLHIKIDFESLFFFRILLFCSSTHEIEREWGYRGYFFFHFSLKRQALKQESCNNAELKCLFLQYKKNKSNKIHGFTTTSVVTPQIKIKNLYLRDH